MQPSNLPLPVRDLEHRIIHKPKENVQQYLKTLSSTTLASWEKQSDIVKKALYLWKWWPTRFEELYPLTYQRLQRPNHMANAKLLLHHVRKKSTSYQPWRGLLLLLEDATQRGIWKVQGRMSRGQEEWGIDIFHILSPKQQLYALHMDRNRVRGQPITMDVEAFDGQEPMAQDMWSFQTHALVFYGRHELVLLPKTHNTLDPSNWSINRRDQDPSRFQAPAYLDGDVHLGPQVIVSSIPGRLDKQRTIRNGVTAVVMQRVPNGSELVLLDQVQQQDMVLQPKDWTLLITFATDITGEKVVACCWVLDKYLLVAMESGTLWARPRGNPRSTYYVGQRKGIQQLASLYNVLVVVTEHILSVYKVESTNSDPFFQFNTLLYEDKLTDALVKPLLYGPYVLYRRMDSSWVRANYETHQTYPIQVPFHAAWSIVGIKAANWRYWTLVLQHPQTKEWQDHMLLVGGVKVDEERDYGLKPFLIASCVVCGEQATVKCAYGCSGVRYCETNRNDKGHREHWTKHKEIRHVQY